MQRVNTTAETHSHRETMTRSGDTDVPELPSRNAIIEWLSHEEGGRRNAMPVEVPCRYCAVVLFPESGELRPNENSNVWPNDTSWSLVVELIEAPGPLTWHAKVRFLVEAAPHHFLDKYTAFELFEGRKLVARGRILKGAT